MKLVRSLALVGLASAFAPACAGSHDEAVGTARQALAGDGLVISQIYGGGSNTGATFNKDFVEIFNRSDAAVSTAGLSIQYASAAGTGNFSVAATLPTTTIPAGGYFLVVLGGAGTTGAALPTADATGSQDVSGTAAKVVLARTTSALGCGGSTTCTATHLANVVDLVGFGTTATLYEGAGRAPTTTSATAVTRKGGGCVDTNDNAADFVSPSPAAVPHNTASAAAPCAADAGPSDAGEDSTTADTTPADTTPADATDDVVDSAIVVDATDDATDDGGTADTASEDATDASIDDATIEDSTLADSSGDTASGDTASDAAPGDTSSGDAGPIGAGMVISQVYGGGGNSMATLNQDYVELFNRTDAPISLDGLSIQYGSATGNFANPTTDGGLGTGITLLPNVTVPGKSYYLVAMGTAGTTGGALPAADFTGPSNLSGSSGKVALARVTTSLGCGSSRCITTNIVDMVAYGSTSDYEGSGGGPALTNTTAAFRKGNGCVDTDDNAADLEAGAPAPRNLASGPGSCTVVVVDGGTDTAVVDSTPTDTAVADSTTADTATSDTATSDTGVEDTAVEEDTSSPVDTGVRTDTGVRVDTGTGVAPADTSDEGCSCRTTGSPSNGNAIFGALAAIGAIFVRRRRR